MPKKSKLPLPQLLPNDESPGQRLARFRKAKGLTQSELAARIGLIQALISDYERDKLRLSAEMAVRLAVALGLTTDELLGIQTTQPSAHTSAPETESPEVRRIWKKFQQLLILPEKDQRAVIRLVNSLVAAHQGGFLNSNPSEE